MNADSTCTRWILSRFDPRCPGLGNRDADGSEHDCRVDLSKDEASATDLEAEPKLDHAEPFAELAFASGVLPRVQTSIIEDPAPVLPLAVRRDDQSRLR